jgi:chemotaxis protein MotA
MKYAIDLYALLTLLIGTLLSALLAFSPRWLARSVSVARRFTASTAALPEFLTQLAIDVRSSGDLAFERAEHETSDKFLQEALILAADTHNPEALRAALRLRRENLLQGGCNLRRFWKFISLALGCWAAVGAIGGLIYCAARIAQPEAMSPGLRFSLCSALYGVALDCLIAAPASYRARARTEAQDRGATLLIEGLTSIQSGDLPNQTSGKLRALL